MSVILETKQLCKFYGAGENLVKAVNQVDIQIEQGEFVAIVGKGQHQQGREEKSKNFFAKNFLHGGVLTSKNKKFRHVFP